MSVSVSIICPATLQSAPSIAGGVMGLPSLEIERVVDDGINNYTFGWILSGLQSIGLLTREMDDFREYLIGNSGHEVLLLVDGEGQNGRSVPCDALTQFAPSPKPEYQPCIYTLTNKDSGECFRFQDTEDLAPVNRTLRKADIRNALEKLVDAYMLFDSFHYTQGLLDPWGALGELLDFIAINRQAPLQLSIKKPPKQAVKLVQQTLIEQGESYLHNTFFVEDTLLVARSKGLVRGYDIQTRQQRWSLEGPHYASFSITGNGRAYGLQDGLICLDVAEGNIVWQIPGSAVYHLEGQTLFTGNRRDDVPELQARDARNGAMLWSVRGAAGEWINSVRSGTSIAIADFSVQDKGSVRVVALDMDTGQQRWTLDPDEFLKREGIEMSGITVVKLCVIDSRLLVSIGGNVLLCVNLFDGQELWCHCMPDLERASLFAHDGNFWVMTNTWRSKPRNRALCFDPVNGELLRASTEPLTPGDNCQLYIADGLLLAGEQFTLAAYSLDTLQRRWLHKNKYPIFNGRVIKQGRNIVASGFTYPCIFWLQEG